MNKVQEQEVSIEKLRFWYKHGINVMLTGKHGVGKTQKMLKALGEEGLEIGKDFLYFSAATLDPWVDFVGVPKEVTNDGETFLDLVRPRIWKNDVKIIILDEFNRAPKKVRNAVMELVQFRSINGMKIENLKCVWVAENPDDEEGTYDVEKTDPAQKDRFQVQINVPYRLDKPFFVKTFGKELSSSIGEWWASLSVEDKDSVSPRRVEYIIEYHKINGDIRDLGLPASINITRLKSALSESSPMLARMREFYTNKDVDGARSFINDENCYNSVIGKITKNKPMAKFFIPLMSEEKIAMLIKKNTFLRTIIIDMSFSDVRISNVIKTVQKAAPSSKIGQEIKRKVSKLGTDKIRDVFAVTKKEINTGANRWYKQKFDYATFQRVLRVMRGDINGDLLNSP